MPYLSRITIYPVKSLDGHEVDKTTVLPGGALEYDRRFAIRDAAGNWVNGKRTDDVHRLRSSFEVASRTLALRIGDGGNPICFQIDREMVALEAWLSGYFGLAVHLVENDAEGFPDDTLSPGPTAIGAASYEQVAAWFPPLSVDQIRRRFRANLEIADAPPFWEDRLIADVGSVVEFQIGEVTFEGVNASARCVVPSRDTATGETYPQFAKVFAQRRRETLPAWAPVSRFDHYYRLAVNTRVTPATAPRVLRVGDEVRIVGVQGGTR